MEALQFLRGRPVAPARMRLLLLAFAACGLALFAATWKLWSPQTVYPQVPLFAWAGRVPAFVEWLALAGIFGSLGMVLIGGCLPLRASGSAGASPSQGSTGVKSMLFTVALLVFAVSASLLLVIDQHRLQPWAYQFVVFALILAALPAARALVLLRWIVVSIYFWSALAKLDASFIDSLGQQFLLASVNLLGVSADSWSPAVRGAGALAFPLVELLVAVGLCFPLYRLRWLRRVVLTAAVVMHLVLIIVLSPLGLDHQPGVMIWNVWFIAQALLLFGFPLPTETPNRDANPTPARSTTDESGPTLAHDLAGVLVEFLAAAVILLPLLNLFGRFDHWLAWGLYAPRNSRATLYVQQTNGEKLPEQLQAYLGAPSTDAWRQVRLDQWSLDELSVPTYPEDRFQVGVAEALVRDHELEGGFQLIVESPADRWTGARRRTVVRNLEELEAQRRSYLFNAGPRR